MKLKLLPIPADLPKWQSVADIEAKRESLASRTYEREGVLYWASNDRPVPPHVFTEAFAEAPENQGAADRSHTKAFLAEYRKSRANRVLSDEERFEMRAAFGAGAEVVDVVTGQKFKV